MTIQKEMNLELINKFPELKGAYMEEVNWQEGDETGSHTVYGDVFMPYIEYNIEKKNDKKLIRICDFIEYILEKEQKYMENVISLSILERIIDNERNLKYFSRFASKKTLVLIENMQCDYGIS